MAAFSSYSPKPCQNCGAMLPADALACPQCGRLAHMDELQAIVQRARHLTAAGQLREAKQQWETALRLIPPGTSEYQGVLREIQRLDARLNPQSAPQWTKRLGPFGAVIALLIKFKTAILLIAKGGFLFNFIGFLMFYWAMFGWWYGVGVFLSILIHEFGHYFTARRLGFAADLPRFHIFGAYVRWAGVGVDPNIAATVSLAGPFFGLIAGLLAYGVFLETHQGVWLGVAQFTAFLNLLNLIPVWIFDGARAMSAIAKNERIAIAVVSFALAFLLHSVVAGIVGVATLFRLYGGNFPSSPKQRIAYTFIALVIATAFLDWFCTEQRLQLFGR